MINSHLVGTVVIVALSAVAWLRFLSGGSVLYGQAVAVLYVGSALDSAHALLMGEGSSASFLVSQVFWVGVGVWFLFKFPRSSRRPQGALN